mgnify:CR=1 FL=1
MPEPKLYATQEIFALFKKYKEGTDYLLKNKFVLLEEKKETIKKRLKEIEKSINEQYKKIGVFKIYSFLLEKNNINPIVIVKPDNKFTIYDIEAELHTIFTYAECLALKDNKKELVLVSRIKSMFGGEYRRRLDKNDNLSNN